MFKVCLTFLDWGRYFTKGWVGRLGWNSQRPFHPPLHFGSSERR